MKIIRFLLKPMKYFLIFSAIGALIYYRTIIFHSNVNQYIDIAHSYVEQQLEVDIPKYISDYEAVAAVVQVEEQPVVSTMPDQVVSVPDQQASVEVSTDDPLVTSDVSMTETSLDNSGELNEQLDLIEGLTETVNVINKKVDMLFDMNTAAPVSEVPPVKAEASDVSVIVSNDQGDKPSVKEDSVAVSSDFDSSDAKKMFHIARQSFWNGDARVSEKYYLDLARLEDGDPDVYGELGNVYYAQGKWRQAGKAYYEAAIRLLALKQDGQVSYLLRVIQGLDAESAEKLRHKISG